MGSQHQLQLFARRSYNMRKLKIVSKIILLISVLVTLLLFRIGFHIYENKYFFPWNALIPGSKNVAAAGQNNCQAIWTTVGSFTYLVLGSMIVNLVRNIGSELETFTTLDLADFGELENMMIATGSFSIITGILMFVDVIINLLSVYTTSNMFVSKAIPVEKLAQYQVTEEIMVPDNTFMEESLKKIAGKVGRQYGM